MNLDWRIILKTNKNCTKSSRKKIKNQKNNDKIEKKIKYHKLILNFYKKDWEQKLKIKRLKIKVKILITKRTTLKL
jgi:hypothetical protein